MGGLLHSLRETGIPNLVQSFRRRVNGVGREGAEQFVTRF